MIIFKQTFIKFQRTYSAFNGFFACYMTFPLVQLIYTQNSTDFHLMSWISLLYSKKNLRAAEHECVTHFSNIFDVTHTKKRHLLTFRWCINPLIRNIKWSEVYPAENSPALILKHCSLFCLSQQLRQVFSCLTFLISKNHFSHISHTCTKLQLFVQIMSALHNAIN